MPARRKKSKDGVTGSGKATPVPQASKSRSSTPSTRRPRRPDPAPELGETIDMTGLTSDDRSSDIMEVSAPTERTKGARGTRNAMKESKPTVSDGVENPSATSSSSATPRKLAPERSSAKGKERAVSPIEPSTPSSSRKTSAFTPFRPMLLGVKMDTADEGIEDGEVMEDESFVNDSTGAATAIARSIPPPPPKAALASVKASAKGLIDDDDNDDANTSVLLVPDNVHIAIEGEEGDDEDDEEENDMSGVHMVDDSSARGASRYFMEIQDEELAGFLAEADQSKLCRRCKKPGHREAQCPHIICTTCGAKDEHERKDCPWSLLCFGCGQRGHKKQDCPDPASRRLRAQGCTRCGVWDHTENSCPSIWRVYIYRSDSDRKRVMDDKEISTGWKREVVGGGSDDLWCYNCAREGHLGDDCPSQRGSLARAVVNTAFSQRMSSRGPFPRPNSWPHSAGTHTRWDDTSLPYVNGQFKGADAGKKSREIEKQRQRERDRDRDRDRDRGRDRDDYDWFNRTPNNRRGRDRSPSPRRRGWDSDTRGRDRSRSPQRRGWDSDRETYRPPAKGSVVGKMSMPPLHSRISSPGNDSPSARRGGNSGPTSLLQRALAPEKHRSKNRKSDKESERDFEKRWRDSGAGGGNVSNWGDQMDKEIQAFRDKSAARGPRDDRVKAGPVRKTPAKGQRYTGGY